MILHESNSRKSIQILWWKKRES